MADSKILDPFAVARTEFERLLSRNIKGLEYFTVPAPVVGATPRDVLIKRGTAATSASSRAGMR